MKKQIQRLQELAGIISTDKKPLQELSALASLKRRILNAVQDNYGISDAVQEFLGWSEEEAEDADGTNWDDVVDAIVRDSKLRSQFTESSNDTIKEGGAGITLDNFEIQVIIKALQSDKVMDPDARKRLIEKLEKLRSGEYDFIDYMG